MRRAFLIVFVILISPIVFLWDWLCEQKSALVMAWLSSFAELPEVIKEIRAGKWDRK